MEDTQAMIDLEAENARLRRMLTDARFADELREALVNATAAGTVAAPVSHSRLLDMIVETAAQVIAANAASLFLVDEETDELVFEVALGQKAAEVKKFRIPVGHGIAGLVAATGQPMAISDAQENPQQASDIAEKVGYRPQSILCVPLYSDERVIGVLELLDKAGADSFSQDDMNALSLFAGQAAVAIEQSRLQADLGALLADAIGAVAGLPEAQRMQLMDRARAFATSVETEDPGYERALRLATLVRRIASHGEDAAIACERILSGFAGYMDSRPSYGDDAL